MKMLSNIYASMCVHIVDTLFLIFSEPYDVTESTSKQAFIMFRPSMDACSIDLSSRENTIKVVIANLICEKVNILLVRQIH